MERVLVIRFGSLGDVVLASAVIEALHRVDPSTHVTLLTKSGYAPLFRSDPRVGRIVGIASADTPRGIARAAGDGFDAVVDLHATLRSIAVAALVVARTKVRIRKHSLARRIMVWSRNRFRRRFDTLGSYLDTLRPLGVGVRPMPRLFTAYGPLGTAVALLASVRGGGGRIVGLAPGSRHPSKRWPSHSWARLAGLLAERGDTPVLIGDSGDLPVIEEVKSLSGMEIPTLAGNELDVTAALVSLFDCLATNDSGLMHLAGALGTPFAAVFGPTHPDLGFAPGYPKSVILHSGLPCSPCGIHGEKPCRLGTLRCMELIEPASVLEALERALSDTAGPAIPRTPDAPVHSPAVPPC